MLSNVREVDLARQDATHIPRKDERSDIGVLVSMLSFVTPCDERREEERPTSERYSSLGLLVSLRHLTMLEHRCLPIPSHGRPTQWRGQRYGCLLYTSDAADERSSVDLGGRR